MAGKQVEFYYDVGSPTSYLARTQLPGIAERTGAKVIDKPMLLGGVMKATGNSPPWSVPAKGPYMSGDLQRWAKHYGVPLKSNPHFPINTLFLMRVCTAMLNTPDYEKWMDAVFNAMWVEPRNLNDPQETAKFLKDAGFDPDDIMARATSTENKQALIKATEEAVGRGIFGAPTFFVGDAMFFGQDRMQFVEMELA